MVIFRCVVHFRQLEAASPARRTGRPAGPTQSREAGYKTNMKGMIKNHDKKSHDKKSGRHDKK